MVPWLNSDSADEVGDDQGDEGGAGVDGLGEEDSKEDSSKIGSSLMMGLGRWCLWGKNGNLCSEPGWGGKNKLWKFGKTAL